MTHDEACETMYEMLERQGVVHTLRIMATCCKRNAVEARADPIAVAGWLYVANKVDTFSDQMECFTSGGNDAR